MKRLVVVILPLLLAACDGGDGGDGEVAMPDDATELLAADPRVLRLGGIVERTEVLLMPGMHVNYSVSAPGETITDSVLQDISCTGAACSALGVTLDLADAIPADLIDADAEIAVSEAELGSRGDGFDTVSIKGSLPPLDIGALLSGITIADIPEALGYGFWGEHGAAGLVVVDGPFSGRVNGIPFSGDMKVIVPFAFGDVSGTSPAGAGGAS